MCCQHNLLQNNYVPFVELTQNGLGPCKLFMQDFSIGKNYLVGVDLKAHSVKLPEYGNQFKFHF